MSPGATMLHHYLSQVSNNSSEVLAFKHFLDALTGTKTRGFNWLSFPCKDQECLILKIRMWKWYLYLSRRWYHKQMLSVSEHSPKATSWANKQRLILELTVSSLPLSPTKKTQMERPKLRPLSSACVTSEKTCGRCPQGAAWKLSLCAFTLCISATATSSTSSYSSIISGNRREFQWIRAQTVV